MFRASELIGSATLAVVRGHLEVASTVGLLRTKSCHSQQEHTVYRGISSHAVFSFGADIAGSGIRPFRTKGEGKTGRDNAFLFSN